MIKKVKRRELPKGYVEPQKLRKEFKENRITGKTTNLFSSFFKLIFFSGLPTRALSQKRTLYDSQIQRCSLSPLQGCQYKSQVNHCQWYFRKFCKTFVQGLSEIENLEEYTDLKCLWLENNSIKTIKGLDHLSLLKCLFLHHNRIEHITVKVLTLAKNSYFQNPRASPTWLRWSTWTCPTTSSASWPTWPTCLTFTLLVFQG